MGSNDFVELKNADAVLTEAGRLEADGETLEGQAGAQVGAIDAIEAETPWGSDPYGQAFAQNYEQANTSVKNSATGLGQQAAKIGEATMSAVSDYKGTDETNAADINRVS